MREGEGGLWVFDCEVTIDTLYEAERDVLRMRLLFGYYGGE